MAILVENYLDFLNKDLRAAAHEWQGPNIPYGDDSNRPNLIRQCTMLEGAKLKINCLRKLRDQAAMNPFYQHRIDRYIDEITDTYEPTENPGTIPGNEFKETGVGEDTPMSAIQEAYVQEAKGRINVLFFLWRNSSASNAWEKSPMFKKLKTFLRQKNIHYRIVKYESNPDLFKKYGVKGAPWTVYLKDGKKCGDVGGLLGIQEFTKWLNKC